MPERKGYVEVAEEDFEITDQLHRSREMQEINRYTLSENYIARIKPMRDLVLVRQLMSETFDAAYGVGHRFLMQQQERIPGWFVGEVVSSGPDASLELAPGDRVVCEMMASPDGQAWMLDQAGNTLCFIPCRRLPGAGDLESKMEHLALKIQALDEVGRAHKNAVDGSPEREAFLEAQEDWKKAHADYAEIADKRQHTARSRRFKPVKDPGLPRGILAIIATHGEDA
ncbi:MAG: hypothetical protein GY871_04095 [Actinomycetales bacterium]|nr:hypothetical protein [Actinomycetales bacterium]